MSALPDAFLERLERIVPPERLPGVLATFEQPGATGFRVNTLLADIPSVEQALREAGIEAQPAGWMEGAYSVPHALRAALLASAPFDAGHVYVQNLSSMIPPYVLAPEPGERVLDLTAAPGSKTLQLAAMMANEGEIAAVEVVRPRFFRLRDNLERHGAQNVRTFLQDGMRVWRFRPEHFDRVLLDAPCSTEGRFDADDPETTAYWSPRKVKEMARKQRKLLFSAVQALRPGGVLVYSTCSFSPEENEATLDRALRTFGGALHLEALDADLDAPLELDNMLVPLAEWNGRAFQHDLSLARRVLPTSSMEGFFVARLRKTASTAV